MGHSTMTPSQQAKAAGLKNLLQVQQLTGQSAQTLTNWHRDKPELFKIVLLGCVAILKTRTGKRTNGDCPDVDAD